MLPGVGDLVQAAVEDGQPALGITDHGNMYGVLDFYRACKEGGINPVIGTEAYMAAESRHERPVRRGKIDDTGGDVEGGQKLYYHLTLLAETTAGYHNLMKLSSDAYLEGYYYKPRVDWELLDRHHHGLIATTGCLGGVVLQALLAGNEVEAERRAARLQEIFGATTSSSSSRTTASPTNSGPTPSWSPWPSGWVRRCSPPTTATTPTVTTPSPTTRCCACRPGPPCRTPTGSVSRGPSTTVPLADWRRRTVLEPLGDLGGRAVVQRHQREGLPGGIVEIRPDQLQRPLHQADGLGGFLGFGQVGQFEHLLLRVAAADRFGSAGGAAEVFAQAVAGDGPEPGTEVPGRPLGRNSGMAAATRRAKDLLADRLARSLADRAACRHQARTRGP